MEMMVLIANREGEFLREVVLMATDWPMVSRKTFYQTSEVAHRLKGNAGEAIHIRTATLGGEGRRWLTP